VIEAIRFLTNIIELGTCLISEYINGHFFRTILAISNTLFCVLKQFLAALFTFFSLGALLGKNI